MEKFSLIVLSALFLARCGPSSETQKEDASPDSAEDLWKYEAEFHPSDYEPDVAAILDEIKQITKEDREAPAEIHSTEPVELVSGFRVQIFASSNIDVANAAKLEAEGLFPQQWFYLVYDAPTYKIRAGNFVRRYDADKFAKLLAEQGYRDAWIVPERVYKNPPERPAQEEKTEDRKK
jgi:hypothetical protein